MSKFDYSEIEKLSQKVPDLSKCFRSLSSVRNPRNLFANKFAHIFTFLSVTTLVFAYFNLNILNDGQDHSLEFRIVPDFINGKKVISYRYADKRFLL